MSLLRSPPPLRCSVTQQGFSVTLICYFRSVLPLQIRPIAVQLGVELHRCVHAVQDSIAVLVHNCEATRMYALLVSTAVQRSRSMCCIVPNYDYIALAIEDTSCSCSLRAVYVTGCVTSSNQHLSFSFIFSEVLLVRTFNRRHCHSL